MASNQNVNKVVYGNTTLIDLTGDNVGAADVRQGKIFHLPSGARAVGTYSGGGVNKSGSRISLNSSLTVNIHHQQAGSGTPSPTNIRQISGWSGCHLHVSPTTTGGTVYNISWSSEAGDVFDGTLDLATGELVSTSYLETLPSDGWNYANGIFYRNNAILSSTLTSTPDWVCNQYAFQNVANTSDANANWPDFSISNGKSTNRRRILVKDTRFTSAADFMAALTTPIQVLRPFANIQTYQLTPPQIKALLGACNIWADCGDVACTCA